jgi:ribosomal protein S18 acetylase RimI-like enzyme
MGSVDTHVPTRDCAQSPVVRSSRPAVAKDLIAASIVHSRGAAGEAAAPRPANAMTQSADEVSIRTELRPGDIGMVIHLHGSYYGRAHGYGIAFETYVALGLHEFYTRYDPSRDRFWLCEHEGRIVGSLLVMHREEGRAQLRYFLVLPEYRGIGLGRRLMELAMAFLADGRYRGAYLWTVDELPAAAALYRRFGFRLTEERPSTAFGKPLREQRYDLTLPTEAGR